MRLQLSDRTSFPVQTLVERIYRDVRFSNDKVRKGGAGCG